MSGFDRERQAEPEAPGPADSPAPLVAGAPELVRRLSRTAGNRAVSAWLQRHGTHAAAKSPPGKKRTSWDAVEADLSFSRYGNEALEILTTNKIKLDLRTDGPVAGFAPDQNRCFINLSMPSYEISAYFVHEMYHASQYHGGRSPAAATMDEEPWVKMMVAEEVEGTVKGYLHKLRLESFKRAPKDDRPAGMDRFRGAFWHAFNEAIAEGLEPSEARKRGIKRGARMVRWMFKRPSRKLQSELGPNRFDTYEEYYRREWQRGNPPKP